MQDTTAPAINAPLYLVVQATSLGGAIVNYPQFATDAVGPITYTYSIPSGSNFPLIGGFTTVTMTATDHYGNTSSATFQVFVHDSTPPAFTSVSSNLVIEATGPSGAVVNYAAATATDALASPVITYSKGPGSTFGIGTTTVWVTATDIVGNTTTKSFTVIVRDTTPPAITLAAPIAPVEATSSSGAIVNYAPATVTDAVGPVTVSYSKSSGSTFAIGTTTVVITAKDAHGNTSTASFTVTVQDTTPPTIVSAPNLTIEATSAAGAAVTFAPVVTDAVGPVTLSYSKPSGSTFAIGTTTVTLIAKDGHGNTSTATFTVTVQDTTPPSISAPNLTIEATSTAGAVVTFAPTITDAVGPITVTYSMASGSTFGLGTTTVTITAKDGAGNISTKTFTITVRDTTPPTITSISGNLTVTTSSSSGAVVNYAAATATDLVSGVAGVTITYSKASGSTFAVGTTTVTVTATDGAGNKTTKTFTVTVIKH